MNFERCVLEGRNKERKRKIVGKREGERGAEREIARDLKRERER